MKAVRVRVLFLTLYPNMAASPRYRVAQFLPFLQQQGVDCTVESPLSSGDFERLTGPDRQCRPLWYHLREFCNRVAQILHARRYDVVFVQKAIMTAYISGFGEWLRSRTRCLVYDIDDAVHLAPPHPLRAPWTFFEDRAQIRHLMASANLVLAGNTWLQQEAQSVGANAVLFPTVVDTERFRPAAQDPDVYRIGWIGNPSTTICLEPAAQALGQFKKGTISLIGADPNRVPFPGAEIRPWSFDSEVAELHRLSVGIMPHPEGEWMRGKCALKALQYMACGIPCVATPFGAALDFMRHGENALLATTTTEWVNAFEQLTDPALRHRLAQKGRETVEQTYALHKAAPRLLALLETVA